jgi:hypothetical protein
MVLSQAANGFSGMGTLKTKAFQQANEFCSKEKKFVKVTTTIDSSPPYIFPYIFGNFPRTEIQFMCLDKSDPEFIRQSMQKVRCGN